jgi:hypothetical protein
MAALLLPNDTNMAATAAHNFSITTSLPLLHLAGRTTCKA